MIPITMAAGAAEHYHYLVIICAGAPGGHYMGGGHSENHGYGEGRHGAERPDVRGG